ncbi:deoxyguanosinetriphosphate triphosphohydrolase [Kineococcus xinjiangensis]|uniref:deoxyguanosinetriphosphate triphosphohydrolase n=1 Tax=Kineococcus xinjiangensis TaxID=512762 RepID=UPI000CECC888
MDGGPTPAGAGERALAEGYGPADVQRWVPEPPKTHARSPFARDRARLLHSAALRRLAAKTQVVGPGSDDFVRNRLTHSLEVAQVGRELGAALGCDPDVVDTACLAHDLGHPPFGHNGEQALDEVARDIGGFEGNAQTLRLLTRLEPKVVGPGGRCAGLNLTRASLDASTKYPWRRGGAPGGPTRKFGAYDDDAAVFGWLREGAPPGRRCVEAQVMDFADDVAYSVHDVEDAVVAGHVRLRWLQSPETRATVAALVRQWYLPAVGDEEVDAALLRLAALPYWAAEPDGEPFGGRRHLAALKDMTSQLIGRFAGAAEVATRAVHGPGRLTRFGADVVVPHETAVEVAALKGVAAVFVMVALERQPLYARQRELLLELVAALLRRAPDALEPPFAEDYAAADDDAQRLRVVVDQVASLTDSSAVTLHARLA